MRVVVDTNVLFSALYQPDSDPGKVILLAAEGALELFAPATVREELERTLRAKLEYSESEWKLTLESLPVRWIEPLEYESLLPVVEGAIRDLSDAPVVAVALLLGTGVLSGDRDFHPLKRPIVPTWKPRDAVRNVGKPPRRQPRPRRRTH